MCACVILSGCAMQNAAPPSPVAIPTLKGKVHGGNQPVVGATIQLYAAGTAGYASPAQPLISKSVTTDTEGNFTITGDYTCPSVSGQDTQVYITATGGNPGLDGEPDNNALALMTTLGSCSALTSSTSININELTTVAAVWSLAQFMSGYANVGVTSTNYSGLQNAFFTSTQLVSNYSGLAVPSTANTTIPIAELDTLANILAACVNSTGDTSTATTPCSKLFAATTPTGGTPAIDTIGAALNIALNPASKVSDTFGLSTANAPFQPTLGVAPPDWTVGILTWTSSYTKFPFGGAVDGNNNYWEPGSYQSPHIAVSGPSPFYNDTDYFFYGAGSPAFGQDGTLYLLYANNHVGYGGYTASSEFTGQAGGGITGEASGPMNISIAPNGNLWIPLANGALAEFSPPNIPVSPATGFTGLLTSGTVSGDSAFDSSGYLYVQSGTVIDKVDTNPTAPTATVFMNTPNGAYSLALDHAGDLWYLSGPGVPNAQCCATVSEVDSTGDVLLITPYTPGNFNANNLAIDGYGHIWLSLVNPAVPSIVGVAVFSPQLIPAPAMVLGSAFVTPGPSSTQGVANPSTRYLALDQSGNVWTTVNGQSVNDFINPTLELVGVAGPVTTPLSLAVKNNGLGIRP
jgi:hypothetical protein